VFYRRLVHSKETQLVRGYFAILYSLFFFLSLLTLGYLDDFTLGDPAEMVARDVWKVVVD